jgi:PAS domain S-box-containing protein
MKRLHDIKAEDYHRILDEIPALLFISFPDHSDRQKWTTFYNKMWYEYTGLEPEDVVDGWRNLIHPDDLHKAVDAVALAEKDQSPYEIEIRIKSKKTGEYNWFWTKGVPVRNNDGDIINWVGVSTNINHTKQRISDLERDYNALIAERRAKLKEIGAELRNLEQQTED